VAYLEMISGNLSPSEKDAIYKDLKDYCELDTKEMVEIVQSICS